MDGESRPAGGNGRVHAALLVAAFFFSLNYIIAKFALRDFHPLCLAYLRVAGSAFCLALLATRLPRAELTRRDRRDLVTFTLLGVVINQILFISGLSLTSAHEAAILITTIPAFTLAAAIAAGRERGTVVKVIGIAIAAAGAIAIVGTGGVRGSLQTILGDALIILNCLSYSLYLVLSKPMMHRLSAYAVVPKLFAYAAVLMLPLGGYGILVQEWDGIRTSSWFALLGVILGPTVGAYLLNAWALGRAPSSTVAVYTYLQPVGAALLAMLFLGEKLSLTTLLAGGVICIGVFLASRPAPLPALSTASPGIADEPGDGGSQS